MRRGSYLAIKRAIDIVGASAGLCLGAPLLLGIGVVSAWRIGRPVLFTQPRPGRDGAIFHMIKFRTMREAFDEAGQPLPDAARLTPFGRWLRASSLDELPELWHVLRGEMSLVGPRPLLVQYLPRYTPQQARRHELRPGLTGWAQINGRNALSWEEKFALDVWYVDHASLALDVQILWRTVMAVLRREGIAGGGEATMSEFMGSPAASATDAAVDVGAKPATSAPATAGHANLASPPKTPASGGE